MDTHIWLWWINSQINQLSVSRCQQIDLAETVGMSAISCFEVTWLEQHGRITLPCNIDSWFEKSLGESGIALLPITPAIAARAVGLHAHHSDPQDRINYCNSVGAWCRKTHALDELLDLLKDENLAILENEEQLEYLTPYAVLWRYDFDSSESLARENTMDVVKQVYRWAENHIALVHKGLGT